MRCVVNDTGPATPNPMMGPRGPCPRMPGQGPDTQVRYQSAGAAIGFTPDRSSRVTRIVTSVMMSASSMIPAATT